MVEPGPRSVSLIPRQSTFPSRSVTTCRRIDPEVKTRGPAGVSAGRPAVPERVPAGVTSPPGGPTSGGIGPAAVEFTHPWRSRPQLPGLHDGVHGTLEPA